MKKKTPIKGVGVADDVINFVNNISNFSGCVNALLRRLMHDKDLQEEFTKSYGIAFGNAICATLIHPKQQELPYIKKTPVFNEWEVEA